MTLTEETRTPDSAIAEASESSCSVETSSLPMDVRQRLRLERDDRILEGERYSIYSFAWDLLVNREVDMSNYQLRVNGVSRTEGIVFKDDGAVGDAVIEVVQRWTAVDYSVLDLDPELLKRTGLDQLRPRF